MTKRLLLALSGFLCFISLSLRTLHGAVDPQAWSHEGAVTWEVSSPVRVVLPPDVLAQAQPDLRDIRFLNAESQETPYLILPNGPAERRWQPVAFSGTTLQNEKTEVVFTTGLSLPVAELLLQVAGGDFVASATVEVKTMEEEWRTVVRATPVFRLGSAEKLTLPLTDQVAREIRVTLMPASAGPVAVVGAMVRAPQGAELESEFKGTTYSIDEYDDETVMTVDLGHANQRLKAIELAVTDGTFSRAVTVRQRVVGPDGFEERALARGTVFRLRDTNLRAELLGENLRVEVDQAVSSRHVEIVIEKGDSPPLEVRGVRIWMRPTEVVVVPSQAGLHRVLVGNVDAVAPRYDLASFAQALRELPVTDAVWRPVVANPNHRRPEALAGVPTQGARVKLKEWKQSRDLRMSKPGVQELTLDLTTLAVAREDLADLRIVQDDVQIPFIVERTRRRGELILASEKVIVPERPQLSRWRLSLPAASLPIDRLRLESDSLLFRRDLLLYENRKDHRGEAYRLQIASGIWVRAPGQPPQRLELKLAQRPAGSELWLETDDGDNQGISLSRVTAHYPVIKLLFKTDSIEGVRLLLGNPQANRPRYDLTSVAASILAAERHEALLAESKPIEHKGPWFASATTSALFWLVLAGVVVLLLVLVARLLPKPPAPPSSA